MMKIILTVLLLAALSFSYYPDPPIDSITTHNDMFALSLKNIYQENINSNPAVPSVTDPVPFHNASLILLYPSVDNRISSSNIPKLLWAWGAKYADEITNTSSKNGCESYVSLKLRSVELDGSVRFEFLDLTREIALSDSSSLSFVVPFSKQEFDRSNGSSQLDITLEGNIILRYVKEESSSSPIFINGSFSSCGTFSTSRSNITITKAIRDSLSYYVESSDFEYLLYKPVLHEQWQSNNQFEILVLSRKKLYYASLTLNNTKISDAALYNFDVIEKGYGALAITSNALDAPSLMSYNESVINLAVRPLSHTNQSFAYAYIFSASYYGEGPNTLKFVFVDHFSNREELLENIYSRKLSFNGNRSEDGRLVNASVDKFRPSSPFVLGNLSLILVNFGVIGLLLLYLMRGKTRIH